MWKKGSRETHIHFFPRRCITPSTFQASWQNNQYEEKLILFPVYTHGGAVVANIWTV